MTMTTRSLRGAEKRTEADTDKIGNVKIATESTGKPGETSQASDYPSGANYPQPKGVANVASFTGAESNASNTK